METSEAMETQRGTGIAGTLMANTDGLFGASAGEFTRHVLKISTPDPCI